MYPLYPFGHLVQDFHKLQAKTAQKDAGKPSQSAKFNITESEEVETFEGTIQEEFFTASTVTTVFGDHGPIVPKTIIYTTEGK